MIHWSTVTCVLCTAIYRLIVIALLFGVFVFAHDTRAFSQAQWLMFNDIYVAPFQADE